jgi:hypothetical protein
MQLTRQHFQFIADNLGEAKEWANLSDEQFNQVIAVFRQNLRYTNANFDSDRFERACYKAAQ